MYKYLESFARNEFIHWIFDWKQFARYSFSFLGGIKLGQQTRKTSESTASLNLAERWTITKIRRQLNSALIPTSNQIFQGRIPDFSLELSGYHTKERRNWLLTWRANNHYYDVKHNFFNLVSCSTSTTINHIVLLCRVQSCIRKQQAI